MPADLRSASPMTAVSSRGAHSPGAPHGAGSGPGSSSGRIPPSPDPRSSSHGLAAVAHTQLAGYFSGARRDFSLPIDWSGCTSAQRRVLALLAESVGYGETISYGALARRLALREGAAPIPARAIGGIMASNPIPVVVPCHRVVAADGLGGFSGGTGVEFKRWLLTFEGALPDMLDFG